MKVKDLIEALQKTNMLESTVWINLYVDNSLKPYCGGSIAPYEVKIQHNEVKLEAGIVVG